MILYQPEKAKAYPVFPVSIFVKKHQENMMTTIDMPNTCFNRNNLQNGKKENNVC